MSLTLQFYNTKDNPKKINKSIVAVGGAITLNPFEEFDIENPYVILDSGTPVGNYAKIDNEYYFADQPILMTGERKMIRFRNDVLMTNKSQIMELEVILARSSDVFNSYIADKRLVHQSNDEIINYNLGTLGTGYGSSLVFAAIGGRGT